jgi:hypothetical protein
MSRRPRLLFTPAGWLMGLSAGVTLALFALAWQLLR